MVSTNPSIIWRLRIWLDSKHSGIEDRYEHFVSSTQERDQFWRVELAADRNGMVSAVRGSLTHDHGAYTPYGVSVPYNSVTNICGCYAIPAIDFEIDYCLTNMVPSTPTRGAGRPQGTFVMERLLDQLAAELGIERSEVRLKNLIPAEKMPFTFPIAMRDGSMMTYDSGDYPESQRRAMTAAGWLDFPARQRAAKAVGRSIGIGVANYVELSGRGPFESSLVRIGPSGEIFVGAGAASQGQGTRTMLATIVSEIFDVEPEAIKVSYGDTATTQLGIGTFASRQTVTAGNAVHLAALKVAEKARLVAAEMLEAAAEDLEIRDGAVRVVGAPELKVSLAQVAQALKDRSDFPCPKEAHLDLRQPSIGRRSELPSRMAPISWKSRWTARPAT